MGSATPQLQVEQLHRCAESEQNKQNYFKTDNLHLY